MFTQKPKKVHYERGTKGDKSSHGHRSTGSRDSGVGSSSASDRASLGTSLEQDTSFNYLDIEDQRNRPGAVREALDAANERIRQLEAANSKLNAQLTESNKENRTLKRERVELLNKVDFLMDDLEDEKKKNERVKREGSPRTSAAPSIPKQERRKTPPRRESKEVDPRRSDDERSKGSHRERRENWRELPLPLFDRPPTAPQPPANSAPNPFLPNSSRPHSSSYAPPPTAVTYAPAPITYTTAPPFPPRHSPSDYFPNDGGYHPYPL
jgi:hypothetical protein